MKLKKIFFPIVLFLFLAALMVRWHPLCLETFPPLSQPIEALPETDALETLRLEMDERLETTVVEDEVLAKTVAAEVSSATNLAKLVGLLARDAFVNTDEAQPYLEGLLRPSMDALVSEEAEWLGADLSFQLTGSEVRGPLRRLGLSSAGLGLLGSSDLMMLPRTKMIQSLILKIRQKIEHLLSGKIVTVAGSGSAALADGPLPVGDVLAVLGIAWATYDLYDTQATFERQLYEELTDAYREIRASMHTSLLDTLTTNSGGPP